MKQQHVFSLPALPQDADTLTRHFLSQFMHEFQSQRDGDASIRIYTAIAKTASKTGNAPDVVARALVESGLRAPAASFPGTFVSTIQKRSITPQWTPGSVTRQQRELLQFWDVPANGYKPARRFH